MNDDRKIETMMETLHIRPKLLGYDVIVKALQMIRQDPTYLHTLSKRLYPDLAEMEQSSPSNIERDIRLAITSGWKRSPSAVREAFGSIQRPTNGAFFALATRWLSRPSPSVNIEILHRDLNRLAAQTGHLSPACLGCGYEHRCSIHGCALIRYAADQLLYLLDTCGELQLQLQDSESSRTDLAKRLMAAQKELHEAKSEIPQVHCSDCIYMHDRGKGAVVCCRMNYVGVDPDGYCSNGKR